MTRGITPVLTRSLLHMVHLVTAAILFATGVLLLLPALRAQVTGGHSLLIRDAHRWGGVAFAALPVAIVAAVGVRKVLVPPVERTVRALWQSIHFGLTIAMGVIFTLTGIAIWEARRIPEALGDASRVAHDWLTWVLAMLVAVHVVEVGVAAARTRLRRAAAVGAPSTEP